MKDKFSELEKSAQDISRIKSGVCNDTSYSRSNCITDD